MNEQKLYHYHSTIRTRSKNYDSSWCRYTHHDETNTLDEIIKHHNELTEKLTPYQSINYTIYDLDSPNKPIFGFGRITE